MKDRIAFEKRTVELMVKLYCRRKHRTSELCPNCSRLLTYAKRRIDRCRYSRRRPVCSRCAIRCYNPSMREEIRRVMRFAGPRMLLYHPLIAMDHLWRMIAPRSTGIFSRRQ